MRNALVIARREILAQAYALRTYVAVGVLLTLFAVFFYANITESREASMRDMFRVMGFLSLFVVPIFTMGSIADERRGGTLELLLTCPVNRWEIALGKYIASAAFFTLIVALTLPFYALMAVFGSPDPGPVATGYLGLLLSGYLYAALGIYASSLTQTPLIAAILSYVALFLAWALGSVPQYFGGYGDLVAAAGIGPHLASFESGVLSSQDLAYFLTSTAFLVAITAWGFSSATEQPLD